MSKIAFDRILVVVAHPDDEVLGCGGLMAKFSSQGAEIRILIIGEGLTSRQDIRNASQLDQELVKLHKEAKLAGSKVGVNQVDVLSFPDNRFDTVALLDIVKAIEDVKSEFKPDTIITHHSEDLNIDHQIVFKAVLIASRPLVNETVKNILSCEVPSSTEWQVQNPKSAFHPNFFVALSKTEVEKKIEAMECYSSEKRSFPHPRSPECLVNLAKYRGQIVAQEYAEAFEVIRFIQS